MILKINSKHIPIRFDHHVNGRKKCFKSVPNQFSTYLIGQFRLEGYHVSVLNIRYALVVFKYVSTANSDFGTYYRIRHIVPEIFNFEGTKYQFGFPNNNEQI